MAEPIFIKLQKSLPKHLLTQMLGKLANVKNPPIKNLLINTFVKKYKVNLQEACYKQAENYTTFNDFFTRKLQANARPIPNDVNAFVSPVDGTVYEFGKIEQDTLIQAKGKRFTTKALLADEQVAHLFNGGDFATIYLAPKDYHRIHMPLNGKLIKTVFIPGDLFSVNPTTCAHLPNLFARNERLVCLFDTKIGPFALVFVGAMIVGSIHTVWSDKAITANRKQLKFEDFTNADLAYTLGEEIGYFQLGSTVILLTPKNAVHYLPTMQINGNLRMGQMIANLEK